MAASSKFDLMSSSPDGPTFPNGQRGPYAAASLEKSGSFREGRENRISSNISRSVSTSAQGDPVSVQSLLSDLKTVVVDQKLPRPGDIKRVMSSIVGTSAEESLSIGGRHLPCSVEDIKRVRNNLNESSSKARERAKAFGDAVLKIERFCNNLSRKRSRGDMSSSERPITSFSGNSVISKATSQSQLSANGFELGALKAEGRNKNAQNRRIRTTMMEMDARAGGVVRPPGPIDRDRDVAKLASGGSTVSEEKYRGVATNIDGWEKPKMKKKRSVIKSDVSTGAVLTRSIDGDREPKQGNQQKLYSDDARPRVISSHLSRSGPVPAGTSSQQNGLGMRPLPRNDQDNVSLPNNKIDRLAGLEKEISTLKAVNKTNGHEDNCAANPSMVKANASARGPRSNSTFLSNIQRMQGHSENWDHPSSINKLSSVGGLVNRKRTASTRSSSPPVAKWGGQRPQKISRVARRSNLTPLITSQDEAPVSDSLEDVIANGDAVGVTKHIPASSQQIKKGDHGHLSGLSEYGDSGFADKVKDKSRKYGEVDEINGQNVQKITTQVLPSRKNKVSAYEDLGDGVRRPGRVGRGYTPTMSGIPASIEKLDNTTTTKQRSIRMGPERNESRPGRRPTKKFSDRKGHMRPRHLIDNLPLEFPGQSDDDREELLAAANAALGAKRASLHPFWKHMEPIFGFISAEDTAFLKQQMNLLDESIANMHVDGDDGRTCKGNLEYVSLPSSPTTGSKDDHGAVSNGTSLNEFERDIALAWQTEDVEPFLEQLVQGIGAQRGVSICQALLSAIIEEDEIENISYSNNKREGYSHESHGILFEVEGECKSQVSNMQPLAAFQAAERGNNFPKVVAGWTYRNELANAKMQSNGVLSEDSTIFPEFQYSQMCINNRILLELSEIGLYPEPVPDLAQSEDEEISEGISKLEKKLHEQVIKKKKLLLNLEKVVMEEREAQQRELERLALDSLVGMAYEKYMAFFGRSASGSKNMSKVGRHNALAFVKRTLARCRKFEETGTSCFNEPAFRDIFLSVSSHSSDAECTDVADEETANQFASLPHAQDYNSTLMSKPMQRVGLSKYSDASQTYSHLSEQSFGKEDPWSNRVKKRELLLDDVVGSITGSSMRASPSLGTSLVSGTKGKRSERDREGKGQNRDGVAKIGRPSLSNVKGERKTKAKPKQKTAQLSASVNGLLSKATEMPEKMLPSAPKSPEMVVTGRGKNDLPITSYGRTENFRNDAAAIDLSNLQIPDIDMGVFGDHGQDIGTWLNIDEEGLQDHDYMGLEIPLDDLSEVNLIP
ncbi:uncharacterized protein [Typha latifolia]|uniref:uncharacterized protein isoform X1 n=1 Tax=Typha latifolia TaxID=4733 RepID=UPI003C2EC535